MPGGENHWVVSKIRGEWTSGTVRGWVFEIGWGPAEGWLGFIPDPEGQDVRVHVLLADALSKHWSQIDDFEGDGYRRVEIDVTIEDGSTRRAQIYEALPDA